MRRAVKRGSKARLKLGGNLSPVGEVTALAVAGALGGGADAWVDAHPRDVLPRCRGTGERTGVVGADVGEPGLQLSLIHI